MPSRLVRIAIAILVVAVAPPLYAAVTLVAPTDKLSPEQERATFKLPPGFEIQLVAAEPDIAKPMNIAFDAKGRLWVTDTVEYPWPVKDGENGRDSVKVLSDFGPDGRARKVETFASGLNIPLGVLPYKDGAIVYSIPNVSRYRDTDGDGKADKIEPLLTGFGSVDTHGMTNNFVRGFDGWIYANHGFRNESTVKGTDGRTLVMQSGNTYRFRPDGTGLEFHARGQVNPFGLCFDPLGNLYSADCHTRPQYLLLRGAVYPSFGKPDDGLGFGPEMCFHDHGSTGIAGTTFYDADQFPAEYRGNLFNGNPVTNTINRDKLEWTGSSPKAVEQKDFLTSTDAWFRPVQVTLGPDGALYVADFYNKIIGHYEVDLKHPGRDRASGRIWRIVYKERADDVPSHPDMTKLRPEMLAAYMGDKNIALRLQATNLLTDTRDKDREAMLRLLASPSDDWRLPVHAAWALERTAGLEPERLTKLAQARQPEARTHAMRILAERGKWNDAESKLALAGLGDADDAFVRRAAAEALARHPHADHVKPLLAARSAADPKDTHLVHAIKIALRNQLAADGVLDALAKADLSPADRLAVLSAALGVESPAAGAFAAKAVAEADLPKDVAQKAIKHAVKHAADDAAVSHVADAASRKFADNVDLQFELIKAVRAAVAARGGEPPAAVRTWATTLAGKTLAKAPRDDGDAAAAWTVKPTDANPASADPWVTQSRPCADGWPSTFFSSLPRGEKLTGTIRSRPFAAPAKLGIWIAGHYGEPGNKEKSKNLVRLRDAATNEVLAEAPPPRNDTAQRTTWELPKHAGKQVYIEAVDEDTRSAYAWLAFGRLEPAVVPIPTTGADDRKRLEAAVELAGGMKITELAEPVRGVLGRKGGETHVRLAAARALAILDPAGAVAPLAEVLNDAAAGNELRDGAAAALGTVRDPSASAALLSAIAVAPQSVQRSLAMALAGSKDGGDALLSAVAAGKASPRLLVDKSVRDRLKNANVPDLDARLATLTKGVDDADAALQKLIDARRVAIASAAPGKFSADRGQAVFAKNCAACHKVGNDGGTVGPQLDGVGKRGAERVLEDVIDPSRNVDGAFRMTILTLDDGEVVNGLQRRVEGESTVFADGAGKEFTVPNKRVAKRKESPLSVMPGNFGDVINEQEMGDLIAFLVSK